MKLSDVIAVLAFIFIAAIVFFFPFAYDAAPFIGKGFIWNFEFMNSFTELTGLKNFGSTVKAYPYISGFLKVAILATFGEMIKTRGRTGSYKTPQLIGKFIVWGLYGMLFTIAFAIFREGIKELTGSAVWPFEVKNDCWNAIIMAFSTSLWLNLIFCFPMMLSHEWFNQCLGQKRLVGGEEFISGINAHLWGSYLLKTIVIFWIPAHTITFCLPPDYQILMSAFLSLALGFILTIAPKKA